VLVPIFSKLAENNLDDDGTGTSTRRRAFALDESVDQVRVDYDDAPYDSHAYPQSAPGQLAAIGYLFGLDAPEVPARGCSKSVVPLVETLSRLRRCTRRHAQWASTCRRCR